MNRVLVVCVLVIVLFGSILFSTMASNKNNSPERMRKLRAIKKKKAEERNRAQMKIA